MLTLPGSAKSAKPRRWQGAWLFSLNGGGSLKSLPCSTARSRSEAWSLLAGLLVRSILAVAHLRLVPTWSAPVRRPAITWTWRPSRRFLTTLAPLPRSFLLAPEE
jgi:hypothetical protein